MASKFNQVLLGFAVAPVSDVIRVRTGKFSAHFLDVF